MAAGAGTHVDQRLVGPQVGLQDLEKLVGARVRGAGEAAGAAIPVVRVSVPRSERRAILYELSPPGGPVDVLHNLTLALYRYRDRRSAFRGWFLTGLGTNRGQQCLQWLDGVVSAPLDTRCRKRRPSEILKTDVNA